MKKIRSNKSSLLLLFAVVATGVNGCATTNGTGDPLGNTKKLVTEGHVSLYRNGAFQVPNTSISVIPPGPGTMDLIAELTGSRARQSFEISIKHAADSVYIVTEGTRVTYGLSKKISSGSNKAADEIRKLSRENSTLLVYRSTEIGKSIVGKSWDLSGYMFQAREKAGHAVIRDARSAGNTVSETGTKQGTELASASLQTAKDISISSADRSGAALEYGGHAFVKGYAAVPSKVKKEDVSIGESLSEANLVDIIKEQNETRREWSGKTVDLMSDTARNYSSGVSSSFSKAGKELDGNYTTTGLSLALLKSLRWVLQGILWDATIEPAAKMTAASLGYIGVNFVAFPINGPGPGRRDYHETCR